ncbi:hypothetical protein J3A83DRAFT_4043903, partial [Scleroderma citrinum]
VQSSCIMWLEVLANIQLVPLLLQHLLHNSTIYMASLLEAHSLHCLVKRAAKKNIIHHKTALHHLFHGLSLKLDKIENTSPHSLTPQSLTPFIIEIAKMKEAAKEDYQHCTSHTMVFTDGSCHNISVGAAAFPFVNHNHMVTLQFHLGSTKEHTVFEAKVVGFILATHLL